MSSADIIRNPAFDPHRDVLHGKTISSKFSRVAQKIVCDPDRTVAGKIVGFIPALIINSAATVIAIAESIASLAFAVFLTSLHLLTFCRSEGLQDKAIKCWGYFFNSTALTASLVLWIPNMCSNDRLQRRASLDFLRINCAQAAHTMGRVFDVFACRRSSVSREKVYVAAMQGIAQIIEDYRYSFPGDIAIRQLGNLSVRDVATFFQGYGRANPEMHPFRSDLSRLTASGVRLVAVQMLRERDVENRRLQEQRDREEQLRQQYHPQMFAPQNPHLQNPRPRPRVQDPAPQPGDLRQRVGQDFVNAFFGPQNPVNHADDIIQRPDQNFGNVRPPVNPVVEPQPVKPQQNQGQLNNTIQLALNIMIRHKANIEQVYMYLKDIELDDAVGQVQLAENLIRASLGRLNDGVSERRVRVEVLEAIQIVEALNGNYLRQHRYTHNNETVRLWMQSVLESMNYLRLHLRVDQEPQAANNANNGEQQGAAQAAPRSNYRQALDNFLRAANAVGINPQAVNQAVPQPQLQVNLQPKVNLAAQAVGSGPVVAVDNTEDGSKKLETYLNYLKTVLFKEAAKKFSSDLNEDPALLNLIPMEDYGDDEKLTPEKQKQARIKAIKGQVEEFLEITNIVSRFVALEEIVSAAEKIHVKVLTEDDCHKFHDCPNSLKQRYDALNAAILNYKLLENDDKVKLKSVLVTGNTEGCKEEIQAIYRNIGILAAGYLSGDNLNGKDLKGEDFKKQTRTIQDAFVEAFED